MNRHRCICGDWISVIPEGALTGRFVLHVDDETNLSCWGSLTSPAASETRDVGTS